MELPAFVLDEESGNTALKFSNGRIVTQPKNVMSRNIADESAMFFRIGGAYLSAEKAVRYTERYAALLHEELRASSVFCSRQSVGGFTHSIDHNFRSNFCELELTVMYDRRAQCIRINVSFIRVSPTLWGNGIAKTLLSKLVEIAAKEKFILEVPEAVETTYLILMKVSERWADKLNVTVENDVSDEKCGLFIQHVEQLSRSRDLVFTPVRAAAPTATNDREMFGVLVQKELAFIAYCHENEEFHGHFNFFIFSFQKLFKPMALAQTGQLDPLHIQAVGACFEPIFRVWLRAPMDSKLPMDLPQIVGPRELTEYPFLLRCMPVLAIHSRMIGFLPSDKALIFRIHNCILHCILHMGVEKCLAGLQTLIHGNFGGDEEDMRYSCLRIQLYTKALLFESLYYKEMFLKFGQYFNVIPGAGETEVFIPNIQPTEEFTPKLLDTFLFLMTILATTGQPDLKLKELAQKVLREYRKTCHTETFQVMQRYYGWAPTLKLIQTPEGLMLPRY